MNSIFQSCERWHTAMCLNEHIKNAFAQADERAPHRHDLEALNKICADCEVALKIQRRECPVCHSYVFQDEYIPMIEVDALKIYSYRCSECSRELFSYVLV